MKLTSIFHRWASERSRTLTLLLPVVIVVVALGLRLYGIDWDQGHLYHPDERAILMRVVDLEFPAAGNLSDLLDAEESPLNPRWFPYGSLPLYLLKSVQSIAGNWTELDVFALRLPGRVLSAFADTGTVIAVLVLGTSLYGRRVGLLASGLLAVTVLHIQISHFFTVDPFMVFFTVVSLIFMVRVARGGRLTDSALAGLFVGLALASKASAAALLLPGRCPPAAAERGPEGAPDPHRRRGRAAGVSPPGAEIPPERLARPQSPVPEAAPPWAPAPGRGP